MGSLPKGHYVHECEGGCGSVLIGEIICKECIKDRQIFIRLESPRFGRVSMADVVGGFIVVGVGVGFFYLLCLGIWKGTLAVIHAL